MKRKGGFFSNLGSEETRERPEKSSGFLELGEKQQQKTHTDRNFVFSFVVFWYSIECV
jgi:hypothetical protein